MNREMALGATFLRRAGAPDIADRLVAAVRDERAARDEVRALWGVHFQDSAWLNALARSREAMKGLGQALAEAAAWLRSAEPEEADADMTRLFADLAEHFRTLERE